MQPPIESIKAAGLMQDGQLLVTARCPSCGLVAVRVLDKRLRETDSPHALQCEHYVSLWREPSRILLNFLPK